MGQIILAFEIKADKKAKLQQVCNSLGIKLIDISPSEYDQQLGALAGISGFTKKAYKGSYELLGAEMLVLSGINSQGLDDFLEKCNKSGMDKIALRAILTLQNIFWTPRQLYKELEKEHTRLF